jgi:hypothetical protein
MNRSLSKKKKNLPVTVEPMFIHRLSPRVQELLVFADTLVNMRRDTGTDDDEPISDRYSPTIPFTEARYHAMVREVYAEGRALYENYRDLHPPIAAMPSRPQKKSESTDEQQKSCVFNRIATALDKDGAVELTGMTLRAVVVKLLQTGREQAWKGEE